MARSQELQVQEKKEVERKEEATVPVRSFLPHTDIYENEDALTVIMEVPGAEKKDIDVQVENDVLRVEAKINFANYQALEPLYTEYNVGHFARSFALSNRLDQQQISAQLEDGVLTLVLKKAKEAQPRRIAVS
jgi:HSP20 family molecular chaperone IbpA